MQYKRMMATALAAVLLASTAAVATDATPEQARRLEADIRGWLAGTLGEAVPLPPRPVQLEPAGDRYRLVVPLGTDGPALTGTLRQGDGGKWAVDNLRVPSPARFSVTLPTPPAEPGQPPGAPVRTDYQIRLGEQDASATIDPSFTTPSTTTVSFRDFEMVATSVEREQTMRMARYAGQGAMRPAGNGRIDIVSDATSEGYSTASSLPNGMKLQVDIEKLRGQGELSGVSRERAPRLLQGMIGLVSGALAAPGAAASAPDLPRLRAMLEAVQDLASGGQVEQVAEGLRVRVGQFGGGADRAQLGFGVTTPEGILALRMNLGFDGIQVPDLPLSPAQRGLLPTRIALRPVVSGVATADLMRMVLAATEPSAAPTPPDIAALFSRGGLTMGLESFALDIGGASFTGMGKVTAPSPDAIGGEGQVSVAELDTLLERVKAVPEFAGALPVLAFAKGIARPIGGHMVWDIAYRGGKLSVNDVDLSAMIGGGPKR